MGRRSPIGVAKRHGRDMLDTTVPERSLTDFQRTETDFWDLRIESIGIIYPGGRLPTQKYKIRDNNSDFKLTI